MAFDLRVWTGGALLAACVLSVGCEEAAKELESEDFRRQERDARCSFLVRCGLIPDRDTCLSAVEQDAELIQAVGSIPFGRVEYDPVAAEEYLELLRTLSCEGTQAVVDGIDQALDDVFQGRVGDGDPCWSSRECIGDDTVCDTLACEGSGELCCHGTCRSFRRLAVGDACPLNSEETRFAGCTAEAYCAPPEDDGSGEPPMMGVCTPRSDNGMSCSAVNGCQDGQRCNVGDSNLCYVLSADGEMCNPSLANGSCIRVDQVCDPGSSTCVPAPEPGAPCVQGRCKGYAVCQEDLCVARLREFEPCDGSIPCLGDLDCQDGFCQRSRVAIVCVSGNPPPEPMDTDGM